MTAEKCSNGVSARPEHRQTRVFRVQYAEKEGSNMRVLFPVSESHSPYLVSILEWLSCPALRAVNIRTVADGRI